jgi:hypothetical protein
MIDGIFERLNFHVFIVITTDETKPGEAEAAVLSSARPGLASLRQPRIAFKTDGLPND